MQDMAARKAKVQDITALVRLRAAEGWKTIKTKNNPKAWCFSPE